MKVFRTISICIGSVLIITGLILAVVGFAYGGRFTHGGFVIGDRINVDETYKDVTAVHIDYRAGALVIKEGDSFRIVAANVPEDQFESTVKDGVWTITDKKNSWLSFLNNIRFNEDYTVTVYLPKSAKLEDFSLELGAGKVEAESLEAKDLDVSVGAGEVVLSNLKTENMVLDCGVGSIRIDGTVARDSRLECGVGEIDLSLTGDPEKYSYNITVGLGAADINGDTYSGVTDKVISNAGAAGTFTMDCGVGHIKVALTPEK